MRTLSTDTNNALAGRQNLSRQSSTEHRHSHCRASRRLSEIRLRIIIPTPIQTPYLVSLEWAMGLCFYDFKQFNSFNKTVWS